MGQWFCHINGQQYGPVDEAALRQWMKEGRVRADTLLWTEGLTNWAPARDLPQFAADLPPLPPAQAYMAMDSLVPAISAGGTGGATPNSRLRQRALETLRNRWGLPIGFVVLFALLFIGVGSIPYLGPLARLFLEGALTLGAAVFFLTFVRGGQADIGMLFAGFKRYGSSLGAYLLMAIFVLGWALLGSIPGIILLIIAANAGPGDREEFMIVVATIALLPGIVLGIRAQLSYAMTYYLLADNANLGAMDAIRTSKSMMRGRRSKLLWLHLSFVGWMLLCILTLGIGLLWLWPYMSVSFALFYEDLKPQNHTLQGVLGQVQM